jgi:hypothetical protein
MPRDQFDAKVDFASNGSTSQQIQTGRIPQPPPGFVLQSGRQIPPRLRDLFSKVQSVRLHLRCRALRIRVQSADGVIHEFPDGTDRRPAPARRWRGRPRPEWLQSVPVVRKPHGVRVMPSCVRTWAKVSPGPSPVTWRQALAPAQQ